MTTAITPVVQTELGRLVERRENLSHQITELKRQLRDLPDYDQEQAKRIFNNNQADARERLARAIEEQPQLEEAAAELTAILQEVKSTWLRKALDKAFEGYYSYDPRKLARSGKDAIRNLQKTVDQLEPVYIDPRIRLTNSLAELEVALAGVKKEIREASK